jgi:hypothetical protein
METKKYLTRCRQSIVKSLSVLNACGGQECKEQSRKLKLLDLHGWGLPTLRACNLLTMVMHLLVKVGNHAILKIMQIYLLYCCYYYAILLIFNLDKWRAAASDLPHRLWLQAYDVTLGKVLRANTHAWALRLPEACMPKP